MTWDLTRTRATMEVRMSLPTTSRMLPSPCPSTGARTIGSPTLLWVKNFSCKQPVVNFFFFVQDVLSAISRLPNIFDNYEVPYENWNHLDYLFGIDADVLVYDQVLSNMAAAQALETAGRLIKKE